MLVKDVQAIDGIGNIGSWYIYTCKHECYMVVKLQKFARMAFIDLPRVLHVAK